MTLYEYIYPVAYNNPNNKCIIYINKDIIYVGKIGDIPIKLGKLIFETVTIDNTLLRIFCSIKKEVNYGYY